jgi:hypothetical protein
VVRLKHQRQLTSVDSVADIDVVGQRDVLDLNAGLLAQFSFIFNPYGQPSHSTAHSSLRQHLPISILLIVPVLSVSSIVSFSPLGALANDHSHPCPCPSIPRYTTPCQRTQLTLGGPIVQRALRRPRLRPFEPQRVELRKPFCII